jgi:hypothetical protein
MNNPLSTSYMAVGIASDPDHEACVVICLESGTVLQLPEERARKLADDILRNANLLWPIEDEK